MISHETRPLLCLQAGCPGELRAAIVKGWAHEPVERPTFKELAGDLERLRDRLTPRAAPADTGHAYDVFLSHKQARPLLI